VNKKRLLIMAIGIGLFIAAGVSQAPAARSQHASFTVRSTLDGKTTLPHRIHWLAFPSIPAAKVGEVDFLIDGKTSWVEHHPPYSYGFDANYLVTSWLSPGVHHFTVRVIATDGRHANSATTAARVLPASPPPADLAGSWKRSIDAQQAHGQPAGTWVLTINKIGWRIKVPPKGANLIDVGYLSPGVLELRGGIWTKPHPADNPTEGNGWCDEPFQPVRYHWSVAADTLTLALAGPKRCDGQSVIIAGAWSRL
jgi:hypothetical protein